MDSIDTSEDAAHLVDWIGLLDEATSKLTSASGVPADFSRESVAKMWDWMRPYCKGNTSYAGDPLETNPASLPQWATWEMDGNWRLRNFTAIDTLELIGLLARYHGECLRQAVPEAEWVIWRWTGRAKGASGEGQPALTVPLPDGGHGASVFPIRDIDVLTSRVIGESVESSDILHGFNLRVQDLQAAADYAKSITKT